MLDVVGDNVKDRRLLLKKVKKTKRLPKWWNTEMDEYLLAKTMLAGNARGKAFFHRIFFQTNFWGWGNVAMSDCSDFKAYALKSLETESPAEPPKTATNSSANSAASKIEKSLKIPKKIIHDSNSSKPATSVENVNNPKDEKCPVTLFSDLRWIFSKAISGNRSRGQM